MKAAQIGRFGGPEVFEIVDVRTPQAEVGEVLVRVLAAGVNFFETLMRQDLYTVTPQLRRSSASRSPALSRRSVKA